MIFILKIKNQNNYINADIMDYNYLQYNLD